MFDPNTFVNTLILAATAMVRKILFMILLWVFFKIIDNFYFRGFDTDEIVKKNPIAVAILVGLTILSLAFV